jgi:heat shock protein HslJ
LPRHSGPRYAWQALVVVLLLNGCMAVRASDLAGSEWRAEFVEGAEVPVDAEVFVRFEGEGKITGAAGCNSFFGSYAVSGDKIEMGPVGITRKFCSEALMDLETKLLVTLQETRSFARQRTALTLFDEQGRERARFGQTDWD